MKVSRILLVIVVCMAPGVGAFALPFTIGTFDVDRGGLAVGRVEWSRFGRSEPTVRNLLVPAQDGRQRRAARVTLVR